MTTVSAVPPGVAPATGSRAAGLRPTRDDAVDAAMVLLLGMLGLVGLTTVFAGSLAFTIGGVGLLAGTALGYVLARTRPPFVFALIAGVIVFLVAGGIAVPEQALGGVLPGPETPAALLRGLVRGWKEVLTTPPPVGAVDSMGVVPYVCGYLAGLLGMLLSRRTAATLLPALPAVGVLVASIALGTRDPASVVLQGAVFAACAIGWGSVRANRPRRMADGSVYWPRVIAASLMLVGVVAVAVLLSGTLPSAEAAQRVVLREEIVPPFDPRAEPSPLGGLRAYLQEDPPRELFEVSGLPEGSRMRLATMDTYDGVVWVVGGPDAGGSSRFERVGEEIIPAPPGDAVEVQVRVLEDRKDVWLPTLGWTRQAVFEGPNAEELRRDFRYNRTTSTAAAPSKLDAGDVVVLQARLAEEPPREEIPVDTPVDGSVSLPTLPPVSEIVEKKARDYAGTGTPLEQALALEAKLTDEDFAFYSDGGPDAKGPARSAPGHSLYRLNSFLDGEFLVGNSEQYAGAMALMARSLGLPARVVMGFDPSVLRGAEEGAGAIGPDGSLVITDEYVHAWVEIAFEDVGWVSFDPTPPKENEVIAEPPKVAPQQLEPPQELDPPEPIQLLEEREELASSPPADDEAGEGSGFSIPPVVILLAKIILVPLLLIGAVFGAIVGLKELRARRRRRHGTPVQRLSGAWREVCDRAADRGAHLPGRGTRQEMAAGIDPAAWPAAPELASRIDAIMFGPDEPDPEVVEALWQEADRTWRESLAQLDLKTKLLTMANPSSLRRLRW